MKRTKKISTQKFDMAFDEGKTDILAYADTENVRRGKDFFAVQRVNVDFPQWMVASLDQEADRIGISRQALIKIWVNDRLKSEQPPTS